MTAIDAIVLKLSGYPGLRFGKLGNRLEIDPPNPGGFPLSFAEEGNGFTVSFGSNHWHFQEEAEALDYLAFGLSGKCRLREISRGRPYKWFVEQKAGDGWQVMRETGLIFFPFWRKKTEAVYQNTLFA
jgi:hypothetical protein